jgi:nicotinamide-nucleotide amidase
MKTPCEIITIGSELISGKTLDLNSCYAADKLTALGLNVTRITSIGDDHKMVSEALKNALQDSRVVIVTGGLGSTEDDITNEIVAKALERPLTLHRKILEHIKNRAQSMNMKMTASLEKMAWMPEGSRILDPDGEACGFSLEKNDVLFYFLPGVPDQMQYLMDRFVLPEIIGLYERLPFVRQRILKLYGLSEPQIAETLKSLAGKTGDVILGFYPHFPENHITLTLSKSDETEVEKELEKIESEIRDLLGPYIFCSGNAEIEDIVGAILLSRNLTISVAESCTGGLIGYRLTKVPGSSGYFQGGAVVYSNRSKISLLDVHPDTLKNHGAVSDKTVKEMAHGIRKNMETDLGLAVTGIAGPDGGSHDKPVGTVYIGLSSSDEVVSCRYLFRGNRNKIRLNASMMALDWIRRYLNGDSFLLSI